MFGQKNLLQKKFGSENILGPNKIGPNEIGTTFLWVQIKDIWSKKFKSRSVTADILLIWTIVTKTNVVWTNITVTFNFS